MRSRSLPWLALSTVAFAITTAGAAHASDPATAQALFDQGRKLMAQERWAEACPKLEESQRLDPAGGTVLHLALCREHEGRIATAWALYQDALAQAKHDARKDRAKIAQDRIDYLASRLPRMRVRVAPGNRRTEGFSLSRDDTVVGEAQWGEPLPVDPGAHVLTAKANGRKPWTMRIDIPARPQEAVIDVPELELEPRVDPPKPVDTGPTTRPTRLEESQTGEAQRTIGIVIGGVGVAGVVIGSIFGVVSFSKNSAADKECLPPDHKKCTPQGITDGDAAQSAGTVSTIAFIAGGALVAGGLIVFFTAPKGGSIAVAPSVTPHSASIGLSTTFW